MNNMPMLDDVRPAVQRFARSMEEVLKKNDHKIGWHQCTPDFLLASLKKEVVELEEALSNNSCLNCKTNCRQAQEVADRILNESVDVANFAMMLADNAVLRNGFPD